MHGTSKIPALANPEGHPVVSVADSHGSRFGIDMGTSYALGDMAVSLPGVSLLIREGSTLHF